MKFERIFRNRRGTAMYVVIRNSAGFSVQRWAAGDRTVAVLSQFDANNPCQEALGLVRAVSCARDMMQLEQKAQGRGMPDYKNVDWLLGKRFTCDFTIISVADDAQRTVMLNMRGKAFEISFEELQTIIERGLVVVCQKGAEEDV